MLYICVYIDIYINIHLYIFNTVKTLYRSALNFGVGLNYVSRMIVFIGSPGLRGKETIRQNSTIHV